MTGSARGARLILTLILVTITVHSAGAEIRSHAPWEKRDAIIVLDPFEENSIDFDELSKDPHKVMAIIHQASKFRVNKKTGIREPHCDNHFMTYAKLAKQHNISFGAYHFGTADDPIAQAKLFLSCAKRAGVGFLALDIDGDKATDMKPADAVTFLNYVNANTKNHIWPHIYTTYGVAKLISRNYDRSSPFARGALWIAWPMMDWPPLDRRHYPKLATTVWFTYRFWQFTSDAMCLRGHVPSSPRPCPIHIKGIDGGTDVNVFNGSKAELEALFNPAPSPVD